MGVTRLAPAPRRVPRLLRATVTHGTVLGLVGWLVVAISSILVWVFVPLSDLDRLRDHGPTRTMRARIVEVDRTNSRVNGRQVWRVDVEVPEDGTQATLYGQPAVPPRAGEWMDVEVAAKAGRVVRAEGWRTNVMPAFTIFIPLAFMVPALALIVAGVLRGRRKARLLEHGVLAQARIVSRRRTNVRINRMPVLELTLRFTGEDGQPREAKVRTHRPEAMDEPEEAIVYDPDRPARAALLDAMPGRPVVRDDGELVFRWTGTAVGAVVLPVVLIGVNAVLAGVFL